MWRCGIRAGLQSEHRDALRRVYQADAAWRNEGQAARSFTLLHTGGMQREIDHPRWDPSWAGPSEHTIDDLEELGLLRVEPNESKTRTFVLSMKGRDTATALLEQMSASRTADPGRAPSPPEVLRWLLAVEADAPEAIQVPGRLLDRAVNDGLIEMSGRKSLARRILRLLDEGYLSGTATRAFGQSEEQVLAEAWDLELTMKAHGAGSRPVPHPPEEPKAATSPRAAEEVRDVFISHASEDKDEITRPLAVALEQRGYSVWFDEFELVVGDRPSASIDRGLATSRYGVVILSQAFLRKPWPKRELAGLVARETGGGEDLILPVWHGVGAAEVLEFSPPLADVVAVESKHGTDAVVDAIARALSRRHAQEAVEDRDLPAAELRADSTKSRGTASRPEKAAPESTRSEQPDAPGGWRPRAGGEGFVLRPPAGPLVAHLRNVGSTACVERADLKCVLGRFAGVSDSEAAVEGDDDLVLRFGEGELGGLLQSSEPLIITVTFRPIASDARWEQRIELRRDGSIAGGAAKWSADEERPRRAGGL